MIGKLFFLFAFVCAAQAIALGEISPETVQKLRQAIKAAEDAKRDSEHQINAITDPIEKRADEALAPIKRDIKILEAKVKAAQVKAKLTNVDISECVEAERNGIHKIDRDDVKNCKRTPETERAHKHIGEIGAEIHAMHQAPSTCATNADADKCVLKAITVAQKEIKLHQKEIAAELKHVKPEKQNKCVDDNAAKLQAQVDEVKKNWDACIKKHEKSD